MKYGFLLICGLLLIGCQKKEAADLAAEKLPEEQFTEWYGSWIGDFQADDYGEDRDGLYTADDFIYSVKLNLTIKRMTDGHVGGQILVGGKSRPFEGTYKEVDNRISFWINQAGNGKEDGEFTFTIYNDTLSGRWKASNQKGFLRSRKFKLEKKEFSYDPEAMLPKSNEYVDYTSKKTDSIAYKDDDDGQTKKYVEQVYRYASPEVATLNASTQKLTGEMLKNLKKLDLEMVRNTIYARHGYSFQTMETRQFFEAVDWYIPVSSNVDAELTALEKQNITLLKKFEQYATDNYKSFGR